MAVNRVILIGNVGKTPEVKTIGTNVVANFSVATTEKGYKTKSGAEVAERTEWHNISVWGKLAEVAEKYVDKGAKIYIEGKLRTRTFEKNGETRYSTEIHAERFQLLSRKQESSNSDIPEVPSNNEFPF